MSSEEPFENIEKKLKLINFFDIKPEDFKIENPYNYKEASERIDEININDFFEDEIKNFAKKDWEFNDMKNDFDSYIENVKIITEKEVYNDNMMYILLNDLDQYLRSKEKDDEHLIKLKYFIKDESEPTLLISMKVNPTLFIKNIYEEMIQKSEFKKAKELWKNFQENYENNVENHEYKFQMIIPLHSINKVYYSENKEYILDLEFPPLYKTNFAKEYNSSDIKPIKYEYTLFPFRNFNDEISNLKYHHFMIYFKDCGINKKSNKLNINGFFNSIFVNKTGEIYKEKFIPLYNIQILPEESANPDMKEISYYFKYENNENIKKIFEKYQFLYENKDKMSDENKYKINDENVIKLYYQIITLISEGILGYYNCIDFVKENIIEDNDDKNIMEQMMNKLINQSFKSRENLLPDFADIFNITLTKLIDKYQNSYREMTIEIFLAKFMDMSDLVIQNYNVKGIKYLLSPSRNPLLVRVQRCVVTPTFVLFTPYILDQGNRILREFVDSHQLAMLCVLKMDDLKEEKPKWNNKFMIEYIKFMFHKGIQLAEKNLKFFNFSQSQFRNFSCWFLNDPEKILPKTGDYKDIKIVAKYGARISQTLTTTIKTISIPKEHIKYIKDVERNGYTFSDGVGKISFDLAEKISNILGLKKVPACFQGRFLGCKGVWTTMFEDNDGNIYIRPSQNKFKVKEKDMDNYFELCDYSRYIQAYLNRQVILLLSALQVEDGNFMNKLSEYVSNMENEKFILSLIHYNVWNSIFQKMYNCGINRTNDRLIKSLIESNKEILFNDLKSKSHIYINKGAYVIGIMDEYDVLEYGEAYLHINRKRVDLILDQPCTVAKCPCLHPGDIRVLNFRKYREGEVATEKFKVFEKYENVLIFPQRGKRPHPNECSGSDLDGDNYFVFYDNELIPKIENLVEPMNYKFDLPQKKKDKICIDDVIEYFAEYTNLNNLGIIGDAHLALADKDPLGARGAIPIGIATKFARAVDAPKTGDKVTLEEEENPCEFPHFMAGKRNIYKSESILGKLYDRITDIIEGNKGKEILNKEIMTDFYDKNLEINGWKKYGLLALNIYEGFFNEIITIMKKNEIKGESVLLTGNNIDNKDSLFAKKRNNFDLREKLSIEMNTLFRKYKELFYGECLINFFKGDIINLFFNNKLNDEITFINNFHLFASACYMISYNFKDIIQNKDYLENFAELFKDLFVESVYDTSNYENLQYTTEYEMENLSLDYYQSQELCFEEYMETSNLKEREIENDIDLNEKSLEKFLSNIKSYKIPNLPDEETQYRVLSFPWCIAGNILASIKYNNSSYL